jgi:hypothetical protein
MKTKSFNIQVATLALALLASALPSRAQTTIPGAPIVPLGNCQLSATQLSSAIKLSSCVRASFTASAGTPATQLVVTSVTGIILPGDQIVSGSGATAGTVILSQISGTTGAAGTYLLSAANTTSSASVTTGGIPPGATMAFIQAEVADVRYRDDGAAPTTAIGNLVVHGIPGIFYAGTLAQLQFIGASGSPLLDISFYR